MGGTPVRPILGIGALSFRDHLSPFGVNELVRQYAGYFIAAVQSGIRYDIGVEAVKEIVEALREGPGKRPSNAAVDSFP